MIDLIDWENNNRNFNDAIAGYNIVQFQNILSQSSTRSIHDFIRKVKDLKIPSGMTKSIRDNYLNYYTNIKTYKQYPK